MYKVVLDSTVLVSAFLAKTGVSAELLHKAKDGGFDMCLAEEILEEVRRALLQYQKIRKRYHYSDQTVIQFVQNLRIVAHLKRENMRSEGVYITFFYCKSFLSFSGIEVGLRLTLRQASLVEPSAMRLVSLSRITL